ncbi:MAG: endolytic transglycosylase MltG [Patescibacteria group bacterium]|nr:endolytic transglycosylase MltG [Patescibacteria group bacterium]
MKKLIITIFLIIFILAFLAFWWTNGLSPVNPNDKTERLFIVPKGAGVRSIANSLKKEGFIKDPIVFFLLVKKMGLDGKIQAGDFRLSPGQNAEDIAKTLTHGTLDIWVTIPEGKRAGEIGDILKQNMPTFNPTWRNVLDQNEGYLFPDTYLFPKDAEIETIVSIMRNNFDKKFAEIPNINSTKLTKEQIVTIASLIEREAKLSKDRPLVASVIMNRLNIKMALQIDATIQYALGYQENEKIWWKKNLTAQDLKIDSPYNTYLNTGLPPTPISNPGIDVLNAAINPANTDYLYYISDKTGENHYAKTLEQHNANIRKYGL